MKSTSPSAGVCTWFSALAVFLAIFLGTDPLRISVISNYPHFVANFGRLAPWDPPEAASDPLNRLQQAEVIHTPDFAGPESLAFDSDGRGPYTGVADGRIMRWNGPESGWTEFAYTSQNWTRACIPENPTSANIRLEHVCGRPLGLRFNKSSGDLYIADAYLGLLVVGREGGIARSLSSEAEGQPLTFTNDLDLDEDGFVYFTDTSSKYNRKQFILTAFAWDNSGRLLRYNTATKETEVLLRGLVGANGVSLSKDGSFLVVAEGIAARLLRYWVKGPKAGTAELFALSPGHPDNVRRNEKGEFWVAMHCKRNRFMEVMSPMPWVRAVMARLPIPLKTIYAMMLAAKPHAMVARLGEGGEVLEVLEDAEGSVVAMVSEAEERVEEQQHDAEAGTTRVVVLWMGSVLRPTVARFTLPSPPPPLSS